MWNLDSRGEISRVPLKLTVETAVECRSIISWQVSIGQVTIVELSIKSTPSVKK